MMVMWDNYAVYKHAEEKGIIKGEAKGRAEGRVEGRAEGKKEKKSHIGYYLIDEGKAKLYKELEYNPIKISNKLKLNLRRYSLIWKLDEMFQKMIKLRDEINNPKNAKRKNDLKILHSDLSEEFITYLQYLKAEQ